MHSFYIIIEMIFRLVLIQSYQSISLSYKWLHRYAQTYISQTLKPYIIEMKILVVKTCVTILISGPSP